LDIVYFHAVSADPNISNITSLLSRGADFLLLLCNLTLLFGLAAIGFVWRNATARKLLIASLCFVAAEIFIPLLLGPHLVKVQASTGLQIGTGIRICVSAISAILAFFSLWKLQPSSTSMTHQV
jgi:hypothetical protein